MIRSVCIVGAGAIGGFVGTRLAASGSLRVSALARGATLAALRSQGWRLENADGTMTRGDVAIASDRAEAFGQQDLVVVAVKGPALRQVAGQIRAMLGPRSVVVPAMNGVPWWFCEGIEGFPGGPLQSVDAGGEIAGSIPFAQVLGCVVHASASCPEPGLVRQRMGHGLILGEPRGGESSRAAEAVALLAAAGFDARESADIRYDIWYKLWGNLTMNPVSALTGATVDQVLADPLVRQWCSAAMREAATVGERIGCRIAESPEDRHAMTARLGAFKSSMLQDVEAGRAIELDAIVGAAREIAQRLGIPTPNIDALLGLTRLFGRTRGLYPPNS